MSAGLPSVMEGSVQDLFQKTLGTIWNASLKSKTPVWKDYLDEKSTDKRFYDDVEMVDPGLWTETDEGSDIELAEYAQGIVTRYRPIKFAQRLVIPEEIEEDAVYEEAYAATAMMGRTCVSTQDVYAVGLIDDAANTNVTWGDGVTLANSAHPIRGGSTISNILSPAVLPSNSAIQLILTAAAKMRGGNGYLAPVDVTKVCGPVNHYWRFKEILKSERKDDTANNAINALKGDLSSDPVKIPYMSSSTNWFAKTNAMGGMVWVWRRKPRYKNSGEIKSESTVYVGSFRATTGVSNWRGALWSLA